jgi:hypothetical protein
MNIPNLARRSNAAFALIWVLVFMAVSLLVLGGVMMWTETAARLTDRNNQYTASLAAAEAATEKVVGAIMNDFRNGNQGRVFQNMAAYQLMVPTTTENAEWTNYVFTDPFGTLNRLYVSNFYTNVFTNVDAPYTGLLGYASKYRTVANAINANGPNQVAAAVEQDIQVATIPIFQYAVFYHNLPMEVSCGQTFNLYGRIHANQEMYVLPDSDLNFFDPVTCVRDITFGRMPGDSRTPPTGTVEYRGGMETHAASLNLPIGTNNSPEAVHALLETPPPGEDPATVMGRQRYYNKAEMIVTVTNAVSSYSTTNTITNTVTTGSGKRKVTTTTYKINVVNVTVTNDIAIVTSGRANNFNTVLSSNEVSKFVILTNSFKDAREGKIVSPIDINIGALKTWSETNSTLRPVLGGDVSLIYVNDQRGLTSQLGAVRVVNGTNLPSRGLTLATAQPLYVQGDYNCTDKNALGTTNTLSTKPASLVGDAITILSKAWTDAKSTSLLSSRVAKSTTVNAAFLAGIVETKTFNSYSGGVENFPRFLESWGAAAIITYNGSMVVMFPSRYATNRWGQSGIYDPPARNWAFDLNFKNASKLPPGTPSVSKLFRSKWASVAPGPEGAAAN